MIDFHGWITLRDDPYEGDMAVIAAAQAELEALADEARTVSTSITFGNANGTPFIRLDGGANRRRAEHDAGLPRSRPRPGIANPEPKLSVVNSTLCA